MRLALMFIVGFVVWALAFWRLAAWDARKTPALCFIVLLDELAGAGSLVFLARSGTVCDIVVYAVGGMIAAAWVMRRVKQHDREEARSGRTDHH